ncbi:hypothetical protein FZEAL_431 [Fusarium zealandicum]|uniref:Glycine-rich cell wall structural protein 1 n=1 Tax=Fusarium zealandicum TaxID=1053134 RepID=A0A8H4XPU5_9HYPO|nr:hypothetical protein FZEAL_431 [Fusarium zealandicum]
METITNAAQAAAKAVWGEGETSKEPVSGVKGNTAQGEPYDGGNLDTPGQEKAEQNYSERGISRDAVVSDSSRNETSSSGAALGTSGLSTLPKDTTRDTTGDVSRDTTRDTTRNTTDFAHDTNRDNSKGQNDTRHPDDVAAMSKKSTDLEDVDNTSEGTDAKLTGPGPRDVASVARDNGGDAGRNKAQEGSSGAQHEVGSGTGDAAKKEEHHDPAEDEYVTASGFAADGGDFDASKPGAGREADRLLDQKGVHLGGQEGGSSGSHDKHSHSDKHSHADKHAAHDDKHDKHDAHDDKSKDKPSIGERIKAKLHKH